MLFINRFNGTGFLCALISTIIGVWQSVYLKMLMKMGFEKNYVFFGLSVLSNRFTYVMVL